MIEGYLVAPYSGTYSLRVYRDENTAKDQWSGKYTEGSCPTSGDTSQGVTQECRYASTALFAATKPDMKDGVMVLTEFSDGTLETQVRVSLTKAAP